ncbi:MAG: LysM peptidoglycan-binding domain-containing protein, partial [Bauldia sp.]
PAAEPAPPGGTPPPAAPPMGTPPLTAALAAGHAEGTAAPATTITVAGAGGSPLTAVADGEGRWILPLPPLPAGAYALRVTTAEGVAEAAVVLDLVLPLDPENLQVEVAIAAPAFAAVSGTLAGPRFIVVGPRDTLWDIAVRAYGDGLRYREIFAANRDQLNDPRRIFAGQVLLIP